MLLILIHYRKERYRFVFLFLFFINKVQYELLIKLASDEFTLGKPGKEEKKFWLEKNGKGKSEKKALES